MLTLTKESAVINNNWQVCDINSQGEHLLQLTSDGTYLIQNNEGNC